jgi:putative glutamine amidotransferase
VGVPNSLVSVNRGKYERNSKLEEWLNVMRPQALVLSGGNDIGQSPERDATERDLLSWAEDHRIPVLGICRGLQMIAVWSGIKLIEIEGHVRTRHQLSIQDAEILPAYVNSFHNWGLESLPQSFRVLARAEDNSIEAIAHNTLPWEGWMWHPEREAAFQEIDTLRLKMLFNG